jgi:DNA-binding response OmpR family regulator
VDANDTAAAKRAGVAFIPKSVSPDELVATLTLLLRKE